MDNQDFSPDNYNPERETLWMKNSVRLGLSISGIIFLILLVLSFLTVPFGFRDTKKSEHKFIHVSLYIIQILGGAGLIGIGIAIEHDEIIASMLLKKKRTLTTYELAVSEQFEKQRIMEKGHA